MQGGKPGLELGARAKVKNSGGECSNASITPTNGARISCSAVLDIPRSPFPCRVMVFVAFLSSCADWIYYGEERGLKGLV